MASPRKFGLIGEKLHHSLSKILQEELFLLDHKNDNFDMLEIPIETFSTKKNIKQLKTYRGLCVTIPYKTDIIPYLDRLDQSAQNFGAVNVVHNDNGTYVGYNTDVYGFLQSLASNHIALTNAAVCVLGAGGVGHMFAIQCALSGAKQIDIAIRPSSKEKAEDIKAKITQIKPGLPVRIIDIQKITGTYDLLINATPVGTAPNVTQCPVDPAVLNGVSAVFDCIYNPPRTALLKACDEKKIKAVGGMSMLVWQAVKAHEIWDRTHYKTKDINHLISFMDQALLAKQSCILLCGFMGCGKSTVGKRLASSLMMEHIDLDDYIERQERMTIPQIFSQKSEQYFRQAEKNALKTLCSRQGCVISVGGGTLANEENMALLGNHCRVVFLDTPFEKCYMRIAHTDRPLVQTNTKAQLKALYQQRYPIYQKAAHFSVKGNRSLKTIVRHIIQQIK